MYEELLIDDKAEKTQHEKIQLVKDMGISWREMKGYIDKLEIAINDESYDELKRIFTETVAGYTSEQKTY